MISQERQNEIETARLAHVTQLRKVRELKNEGRTNAEIAQQLGLSENTVRLVLVGDRPEED